SSQRNAKSEGLSRQLGVLVAMLPLPKRSRQPQAYCLALLRHCTMHPASRPQVSPVTLYRLTRVLLTGGILLRDRDGGTFPQARSKAANTNSRGRR
ncbi:MAG: hypothetical protein QF828_06705, partial [Pseudomonadales bacterium]|nr:hypothetical protein [Pseudomonadales bacterium]